MWKSQIRKGDDFEEWGQQLKEEFLQRPSHHNTPSPPFTSYSLSIHHSSIPFHNFKNKPYTLSHLENFLKKTKTNRASSPFSQTYTTPSEP